MVYSTEKTLKDLGDKVSEDEKKNAEAAIEKVRKTVEGEDVEAIEKAVEELTAVSHEFAKRLYEQAQASPGAEQSGAEQAQAGAQGETVDAEDVTDAEFEVADDDENK